jgi:hypothetical protein
MSQLYLCSLLTSKPYLKLDFFIPSLSKKVRTENLHLPFHLHVTLGFDVMKQNDGSHLIKQISGLTPAVGYAISPCVSKKGSNAWPIDHSCMETCSYSQPSQTTENDFFSCMN